MNYNIAETPRKINELRNFEIYKKIESESTTMEEKAKRLVILFYVSIIGPIIGIVKSYYIIYNKNNHWETQPYDFIFTGAWISWLFLVIIIAFEVLNGLTYEYRDKYLVKKILAKSLENIYSCYPYKHKTIKNIRKKEKNILASIKKIQENKKSQLLCKKFGNTELNLFVFFLSFRFVGILGSIIIFLIVVARGIVLLLLKGHTTPIIFEMGFSNDDWINILIGTFNSFFFFMLNGYDCLWIALLISFIFYCTVVSCIFKDKGLLSLSKNIFFPFLTFFRERKYMLGLFNLVCWWLSLYSIIVVYIFSVFNVVFDIKSNYLIFFIFILNCAWFISAFIGLNNISKLDERN
ncbi:hypothetical protein [Helicobacter cetorum]|uniref:hypothetical protein n=1 Tax=Helicobacter cetorum TaxID=138563 RepID=UPI000CF03B06|nr:hypothetical protein [Helicobacter cetorum]